MSCDLLPCVLRPKARSGLAWPSPPDMGKRPTALILYNWRGQWPMRRWEHQRIFAWNACFPGPVTVLNIGFPFNPAWITGLDPDLVMIDATALAARYTPVGLEGLRRAMDAVPARARRVAAPLDEFLGLQALRDVLAETRVDLLLTALEPALWDSVYPIEQRPYAIRRFLTAYVDELVRLARRVSPDLARTADRRQLPSLAGAGLAGRDGSCSSARWACGRRPGRSGSRPSRRRGGGRRAAAGRRRLDPAAGGQPRGGRGRGRLVPGRSGGRAVDGAMSLDGRPEAGRRQPRPSCWPARRDARPVAAPSGGGRHPDLPGAGRGRL
jgi:hypothetical protein